MNFRIFVILFIISVCCSCNTFDDRYLAYIFVRNNTACTLDIYLNKDFALTVLPYEMRLIENVHLGHNTLTALISGTNKEIYSLTIYVHQHNRAYYFVIAEDLCDP